jgi:hypothetical protein
MAGGKNAAHRAAASAQLGADRAHKQAKRAEEAAELAEERARKAGVLEDVVAQAEQAAERAERARRGAVAERKATEAAPRVKHGVRALKALDSSAWPTPLREAYNTTLERITTQAELGDPRYGLACEQCSRLVVLIGLFYERLAHLIENGLTIDSQECAAITRQLGAYENGLNRMLQNLGLTLQADYRRVRQPETITDYLIRAQEAETEDVDGAKDKNKAGD